jgi:hypothetical protein
MGMGTHLDIAATDQISQPRPQVQFRYMYAFGIPSVAFKEEKESDCGHQDGISHPFAQATHGAHANYGCVGAISP